MTEFTGLFFTFLSGAAIGLFHFGGLWWTIRRLTRVRNPEVEFVFSFLLRTGVSIAAFFLVSGGRWEKILAVMLGFLLMRFCLVRWNGEVPKPLVSRSARKIHGY